MADLQPAFDESGLNTLAESLVSGGHFDEWLAALPSGLMMAEISRLRDQAAILRARADQLEHLLDVAAKAKQLRTWPCKIKGCREKAYVNRGPYAYLCGEHRRQDEERRAADGSLPGRKPK